jgi:hypothetical protein
MKRRDWWGEWNAASCHATVRPYLILSLPCLNTPYSYYDIPALDGGLMGNQCISV